MTSLRLWEDAQALMDVCVYALDQLPLDDPDLDGCPDRVFFSDGLPAYDCPGQLSIHVQTTTEQPTTSGSQAPQPSLGRVRFGRVNAPAYHVAIVRCRPASLSGQDAPPVADLNFAARQHMADLWVLWNAIYRAVTAGLLFSRCDGVTMEAAVADDPSGGMSGWVLIVNPSTDGYDPIPDYVPATLDVS